jgi:glycosyltransferase involved in cell wall biosynthesis
MTTTTTTASALTPAAPLAPTPTSAATPRIAGLIPTYNNPNTIGQVVAGLRRFLPDVWVVDDGGDAASQRVLQQLEQQGLAKIVRRARNGGKGAAVKTGLAALHTAGFTHALQIDADSQHDVDDAGQFIALCRQNPTACVLGQPAFDASAPSARRIGRQVTVVWTHIETLGRVIADPMCGFRIYPIAPSLAARVRGDAMDFDPEIAVALAWRGCPIINVPTNVRYHAGGVSHFRLWRDNLLISWMHTRMVIALLWRIWRTPWPKRRALP